MLEFWILVVGVAEVLFLTLLIWGLYRGHGTEEQEQHANTRRHVGHNLAGILEIQQKLKAPVDCQDEKDCCEKTDCQQRIDAVHESVSVLHNHVAENADAVNKVTIGLQKNTHALTQAHGTIETLAAEIRASRPKPKTERKRNSKGRFTKDGDKTE